MASYEYRGREYRRQKPTRRKPKAKTESVGNMGAWPAFADDTDPKAGGGAWPQASDYAADLDEWTAQRADDVEASSRRAVPRHAPEQAATTAPKSTPIGRHARIASDTENTAGNASVARARHAAHAAATGPVAVSARSAATTGPTAPRFAADGTPAEQPVETRVPTPAIVDTHATAVMTPLDAAAANTESPSPVVENEPLASEAGNQNARSQRPSTRNHGLVADDAGDSDLVAAAPVPFQRTPKRRSRKGLVAAVLAIALIAMGAGGFFMLNRGSDAETNATPTPAVSQNQSENASVSDTQSTEPETTDEGSGTSAAAPADPGDIVIGVNGDPDTYVLVGEEYIEGGAHAAEPIDGILNNAIETNGDVDTSTPGDYEVTYTVSDSTGHTATATRTVHVVDSMETQEYGIPVLMYHYVYTEDDLPDEVNVNYILDTDLANQLNYLQENDFYYPSYPEVRAFLEGTHSLPAKSVVLTFDDGQSGFLAYGIPLLEEYGVPATSFVICSNDNAESIPIDHASPVISYQSHSYALHQGGGSVGHGGIISALSHEDIVADLNQAKEMLQTSEAFAYPYGDTTDDAMTCIDEAGILCAFTTENRWAQIGEDCRALPRVRVSGDYSFDGFVYLVTTPQ